ncbi:predicted protein [Lichtheimia corymbifera JMRC:FSU:9682]|uniref:DH domain-containing protein n=1 Tax=Lichtheimia corymbifera JMRC:FSU:9682 TaxID=1263082 RepID=A0A068SHI1_9FUNG|nr:predicted protein [Lichtheimia corymbifera JMRC:FSU:9682]
MHRGMSAIFSTRNQGLNSDYLLYKSSIDTTNHSMSSLISLLGLPLLAIKRYTRFFKELVLLTDPHHPDAVRLSQCAAQFARFQSASHRL